MPMPLISGPLPQFTGELLLQVKSGLNNENSAPAVIEGTPALADSRLWAEIMYGKARIRIHNARLPFILQSSLNNEPPLRHFMKYRFRQPLYRRFRNPIMVSRIPVSGRPG
jgi:hypothetical protein